MIGDGRTFPPLDGDERSTLAGFLQHHRDTLEWKCTGLDQGELATSAATTTMTLGGLLKHIAYVEDHWCLYWINGDERPEPWASVDWSDDIDWDWNSAKHDQPDELLALWKASAVRSQAALDAAIDERGLDGFAIRADDRGESLRQTVETELLRRKLPTGWLSPHPSWLRKAVFRQRPGPALISQNRDR